MYDLTGLGATLKKPRALGDISTLTQALFIQMLNILLNFPGNLSPTRQTSEDDWLDMNAAFKYIM